jgi:hypothetical protein
MVLSLSLKGQAIQEERLLDPEVEGIWSFATSGTAHPVTVTTDHEQRYCENLRALILFKEVVRFDTKYVTSPTNSMS